MSQIPLSPLANPFLFDTAEVRTAVTDSRLHLDDSRLTRAVLGYLSLDLSNASSIVIDGYMNGYGLNIPGFDGMTADKLICMAKAGAK